MDVDDRLLVSAHEALVSDGVLEPLSPDGDDTRAWLDWELASLVEGHFHEVIEPAALSADERNAWIRKATYRGEGLHKPHTSYSKPYWLLDSGERVGTLALATSPVGRRLIRVSSLYVRRDRRRRGIGERALRQAFQRVVDVGGCGLRIPTSWTWQNAVRFYARRGLWVGNWKHSLVFDLARGLPAFRVQIDGTTARFSVLLEGTWQTYIEAEDCGDRLGWRELPAYTAQAETFDEAHLLAPGTMALFLALEGWPLVRSEEHWAKRYHWSDMGMPEGLAYKIAVFEAVDREQGFNIETPRIRGLSYHRALHDDA